MTLFLVVVLAAGCGTPDLRDTATAADRSGVVAFKSDPLPWNPHPKNNWTGSGFTLGVDIRKAPRDLARSPLSFEVVTSNAGRETFRWPTPCPAYRVTVSESATDYFRTEQRLNCAGVKPLESGDVQTFEMMFAEGIRPGGLRLGFEFDDPRVRGGQLVAGGRKFNIAGTPRR